MLQSTKVTKVPSVGRSRDWIFVTEESSEALTLGHALIVHPIPILITGILILTRRTRLPPHVYLQRPWRPIPVDARQRPVPKVPEERYVFQSLYLVSFVLTVLVRHYSYECKESTQDRPYVSRPSRTQQLRNPKLVPKLTNETLNPLEKKKGVADEELAKAEAERAPPKIGFFSFGFHYLDRRVEVTFAW
ncbi:hypothetical protein NM208_g12980 [Fusarium decemcellulare]|uniref:Uncharacterized protein n=1 Tax=Fusarium decemcellulare TaxID=57161 RepID=A0ACC1RQ34_9HYPO|nr:hypothetical protein NM208_g12980 [Fusarium decemcellulare]